MRLFIAIPLTNELKQQIGLIQEQFRRQHVKGNYTPQENLHITLAFIGEYHDPDAVMAALKRVSFKPFSLTMEKTGSFGSVWWTGFRESGELEKLAGMVRHALEEAGIPYDKKKFKAHVTILRKPIYSDERRISPIQFEPVDMPVKAFSLMLSTRERKGMVYTPLGSVKAES